MPNWCECDLTVEGKAKQFVAHIETDEEEFDFNTIVPQTPEVLASLETRSATPLWYDWRCENWGTKWQPSVHSVELVGDNFASILFDTAWSPPIQVIFQASKMFPETTFTLHYYEGGMCFQGVYVIENGNVIKDLCGEYHGIRGG
jgi:hypothetical protein